MFAQLSAVALLALISLSYSQINSSGQCEDRTELSPANNFNFSADIGGGRPWYTIITFVSPAADCESVSGNLLNSTTAQLHWQRKNLTSGTWIDRDDGIITYEPLTENNEGITVTRFPNVTDPLVHLILGIDYDEYIVVYRCVNLNESSRNEYLYVRSTNRNFTEEQEAAVQQIIVDNGIGDLEQRYSEQDPELCSHDE